MALQKAINQAKLNKRSLSIWFIHDQKPGHIHQLKGLEERIANYYEVNTSWVDAGENKLSWAGILLKIKVSISPSKAVSPDMSPDIIIGAGHTTHKTLLFEAYMHNAYSVVLMKPSLPLCFFNAVICPKHDKLKESKRVLNTYGALNTVTPSSKTEPKTLSLMLIGGASKHFKWHEQHLINQIQVICSKDNDQQWLLSDSPRTPSSFLPQLKKLNIQNLNCFHYQNSQFEPLNTLMQKCMATWVTPDSVSMMYESLTSGTPTYTFSMRPKNTNKPSRVAQSIQNLISKKNVVSFQSWQLNPDIKPNKLNLWEADRAAKWLLNQYFEKHPFKKVL